MTAARTAFAARIDVLKQRHGDNWDGHKTAADQEINHGNDTPNETIEGSKMTPKETAPNSCVNNSRGLTQHLNERRG